MGHKRIHNGARKAVSPVKPCIIKFQTTVTFHLIAECHRISKLDLPTLMVPCCTMLHIVAPIQFRPCRHSPSSCCPGGQCRELRGPGGSAWAMVRCSGPDPNFLHRQRWEGCGKGAGAMATAHWVNGELSDLWWRSGHDLGYRRIDDDLEQTPAVAMEWANWGVLSWCPLQESGFKEFEGFRKTGNNWKQNSI